MIFLVICIWYSIVWELLYIFVIEYNKVLVKLIDKDLDIYYSLWNKKF